MDYFNAGKDLIRIIKKNGYKAYFVGGFVRDFIMQLKCNDIDIATNALPDDLFGIFPNIYQKGIKFNSVVIVHNGFEFEVTTFRKDLLYYDNRHPIIDVADNIYDDLKRRDFTINAMAMDLDLNVIDICGGQIDIKDKVIKAVGDPNVRFSEDALRMLRACYFAAKLNFNIEENTFNAMCLNSQLIENVSSQRVYDELCKLLSSKHSLNGLKWLLNSKVANYIPGALKAAGAYLNNKIKLKDIKLFIVTSMFYDKGVIDYYKLSNKDKKYICNVFEAVNVLVNEYSLYDLYLYKTDILKKAHSLALNLKLINYKFDKIKKDLESIIIKDDKDIEIDVKQLNLIFNDWNKSNKIYKIIKQKIINNQLDNNYQKIIDFAKKSN